MLARMLPASPPLLLLTVMRRTFSPTLRLAPLPQAYRFPCPVCCSDGQEFPSCFSSLFRFARTLSRRVDGISTFLVRKSIDPYTPFSICFLTIVYRSSPGGIVSLVSSHQRFCFQAIRPHDHDCIGGVFSATSFVSPILPTSNFLRWM